MLCAPQIVVSLGLVLVGFLLVLGSLGLVRFEFEVWGPFRFRISAMLYFRRGRLGLGLVKVSLGLV